MSHVRDYLWEGKFQLEGHSKNKAIEFRRKLPIGLLGEADVFAQLHRKKTSEHQGKY